MRNLLSYIFASGISLWNVLMDNELNRVVGLILSLVTLLWVLMQMLRAIVNFIEHHLIVKEDVVLLKIRRLVKTNRGESTNVVGKKAKVEPTNKSTNDTKRTYSKNSKVVYRPKRKTK